ncbi:MAG: hypothetical protein GEV05_25490 [Betaproteobacteria bacterium]|nr:hypothetical protein [Betaproteobacteria bacterium]
MRAISRLLPLAMMSFTLNAQSTVLTFDGFSDNEIVPQSYGDRVIDFGTSYGSGGGMTPNIEVDYIPVSNSIPFTNWVSDYATLTNALSSIEFDTQGYIQLTPDAGFDVVLNSFQVAAWLDESFPDSRIFVADTAGATLFDTGTFTALPGVVQIYPTGPLRSSTGLRINIHDFGDLGVDSIAFSQVPTIPEPQIHALWIAGLALVGTIAWKSRRTRRQPV